MPDLDILSPRHFLDEGAFAGPSHAHYRYSNLLCWSGSVHKSRCGGKHWPSQTLGVSTLMMIRLSAGRDRRLARLARLARLGATAVAAWESITTNRLPQYLKCHLDVVANSRW